MFETLVLGRPKCGVFRKLNDSKRNWARKRSVIGKSREIATSVFTTPGPRSELNPVFPKVAVVTGVKARGSKYDLVLPTFPRISTFCLIWLARCVAAGMFRDEPEAL